MSATTAERCSRYVSAGNAAGPGAGRRVTPARARSRRPAALALAAAALLAMPVLAFAGCGPGPSGAPAGGSTAPPETAPPAVEVPPFHQQAFSERRTINYVASEPANNSLITVPVERVTLRFSKPLGAGSFIDVTRDGMKVNTGQVVVAPDNRSMHVPVAAGLTGNYAVKYAAYFYSGYYEEGSFGFSVNVP